MLIEFRELLSSICFRQGSASAITGRAHRPESEPCAGRKSLLASAQS